MRCSRNLLKLTHFPGMGWSSCIKVLVLSESLQTSIPIYLLHTSALRILHWSLGVHKKWPFVAHNNPHVVKNKVTIDVSNEQIEIKKESWGRPLGRKTFQGLQLGLHMVSTGTKEISPITRKCFCKSLLWAWLPVHNEATVVETVRTESALSSSSSSSSSTAGLASPPSFAFDIFGFPAGTWIFSEQNFATKQERSDQVKEDARDDDTRTF